MIPTNISPYPVDMKVPIGLRNDLNRNTIQQCCICGSLLNVPQWQVSRYIVFFCEKCNNSPSSHTVMWHIRQMSNLPISRMEKLKKLKELGFNVGKPSSTTFMSSKQMKLHDEIEKLLNSDEKQ